MRVLHILKTSGLGGCERQLLALLPTLVSRGLDIRVCVLGTGQFRRFVEPLRELGIQTSVLRAGKDVNPVLIARLLGLMRRTKPDLVNTHLVHADFYGQICARILGIPAVSTVHGTHPHIYGKQPYRKAFQVAWRAASRVIAISDHVRRYLIEEGLALSESVRVVHYGMDARGWMTSEEETSRGRSLYGLGQADVAVGVASRLIPDKGHDVLIEAFGRAVRETSNLRLIIAGEGPLRGSLEEQAGNRLPRESFRFVGFVSDMRLFMRAMDQLVFPSSPRIGEGFGLAALEAMAAARPVVAVAAASLLEIVENEVTGFLVPPGDVDLLAKRLVELGQDERLRLELGLAGQSRVADVFSLDRAVDSTLAVYEEVA